MDSTVVVYKASVCYRLNQPHRPVIKSGDVTVLAATLIAI